MSRTASLCPTNRSGRIASWAAKPWRSSIELHTILPSNRLPNRLIPTNAQSWDYDAVGNWDSVTTNSTTQTRGSNRQNEITSVSGATTPTYDNNGNLTKDENDNRFVWDAWNREVKIKNSSNTVIATNAYDALNHKVQVTTSAGLIDKIFGKNEWQVFEEKNGSNTLNRYVWSPVYVDGLVTRDRDTDANGTLDERLFALQDANWNVTGITNTGGTIQERYTETPYGAVTFRDGSGSTISVSTKGWDILHQGAKRDIIGDYDFRNRVYSPTLGRWLSNDPIGFEAGDVNTFRYVGNGPNSNLDPIGLEPPPGRSGIAPPGVFPPYPGVWYWDRYFQVFMPWDSPPIAPGVVGVPGTIQPPGVIGVPGWQDPSEKRRTMPDPEIPPRGGWAQPTPAGPGPQRPKGGVFLLPPDFNFNPSDSTDWDCDLWSRLLPGQRLTPYPEPDPNPPKFIIPPPPPGSPLNNPGHILGLPNR
jgi:RHS repeat-associated protein